MNCPLCGEPLHHTLRLPGQRYYFHHRGNACIQESGVPKTIHVTLQSAERAESDGDTTALRRLWDAEARRERADEYDPLNRRDTLMI